MSETISDAALAARNAAIERLSADETVEFHRYVESGKPSLSPVVNQKLYELYLQGMSMDMLNQLFPNIDRGCLLKARVDGRWDERREVYQGELLAGAGSRLRQHMAESLDFMGLAMAAVHKQQGEKFRKYLLSGDPKDLGEMQVTSWKTYKQLIDSIARLVGAAEPKGNKDAPSTNVFVAPGAQVTVAEGEGNPSRWTPEEADAIRAELERKRAGK